MLKYPCLVLDHDDTVVQSEATINYPYFCYILDKFRPGKTITWPEYTHGCCNLGFAEMCRQKYGFTEQELQEEYLGWKEYILTHTPDPYPGIDELIKKQKAAGGLICVVSHSGTENITRDYNTHFHMLPDEIYGWDLPEHQRKPNAYPLECIMEKYGLKPSELLVIDDMKPAWEMASKVGAPTVFAAWSKTDVPQITEEMTKLCDFSFSSPKELVKFLFD